MLVGRKHPRVVPAALLAACLAALLGCPPPGGGTSTVVDAFDQARARGKLVVASDVGYDPFEVLRPDGSYAGFDIDLVREVARDLGVEVEVRNTAWDGIIPELLTGKVDAIFSGMSVTEDRRRVVDFSEPYYAIGQVILKRRGDARIRTFRDLNAAGMRVATQQGTTGEQAIRDFMPLAALVQFAKADEACLCVSQSQADAVVFDHPFLMKYLVQQPNSGLEGLFEPFTQEPIAAAVRKDSPRLLARINETLARLRSSGRYDELVATHFAGSQVAPVGSR